MILSAALDNGYVFLTLIAIITSVISAVYYLVIVKSIFFDSQSYSLSYRLKTIQIEEDSNSDVYGSGVASHLSFSVSLFTLLITLFMFFETE
jgi:NADH-ubiquinone oxidoreductase chain 2